MPSRGVLYLVWGNSVDAMLRRSLDSIARIHPELPVHVERLGEECSLLDKARMMEWSPFDETLYLDADTVVLDRLDFGFESARRFGLACSICECPWARRYGGLDGDLVEYNTGVLFYTDQARAVFDAWAACAGKIDSSIRFYSGDELRTMPYNDQAGFAQALAAQGVSPFVLPYNWNFRPQWHRSFFGPIKIWHDYRDVPQAIEDWNLDQTRPESTILFTELRG